MSACARTSPSARHPWAQPLAAIAALVLSASLLSACASARNELGTASSDCYIELAGAFAAVHHHGRLLGVRLVSVASLRHHAPPLYRAARNDALASSDQVCLVALGGSFRNTAVAHPVGASRGDLAVAELAYPKKQLIATLVTSRAPLPFGHSHI